VLSTLLLRRALNFHAGSGFSSGGYRSVETSVLCKKKKNNKKREKKKGQKIDIAIVIIPRRADSFQHFPRYSSPCSFSSTRTESCDRDEIPERDKKRHNRTERNYYEEFRCTGRYREIGSRRNVPRQIARLLHLRRNRCSTGSSLLTKSFNRPLVSRDIRRHARKSTSQPYEFPLFALFRFVLEELYTYRIRP